MKYPKIIKEAFSHRKQVNHLLIKGVDVERPVVEPISCISNRTFLSSYYLNIPHCISYRVNNGPIQTLIEGSYTEEEGHYAGSFLAKVYDILLGGENSPRFVDVSMIGEMSLDFPQLPQLDTPPPPMTFSLSEIPEMVTGSEETEFRVENYIYGIGTNGDILVDKELYNLKGKHVGIPKETEEDWFWEVCQITDIIPEEYLLEIVPTPPELLANHPDYSLDNDMFYIMMSHQPSSLNSIEMRSCGRLVFAPVMTTMCTFPIPTAKANTRYNGSIYINVYINGEFKGSQNYNRDGIYYSGSNLIKISRTGWWGNADTCVEAMSSEDRTPIRVRIEVVAEDIPPGTIVYRKAGFNPGVVMLPEWMNNVQVAEDGMSFECCVTPPKFKCSDAEGPAIFYLNNETIAGFDDNAMNEVVGGITIDGVYKGEFVLARNQWVFDDMGDGSLTQPPYIDFDFGEVGISIRNADNWPHELSIDIEKGIVGKAYRVELSRTAGSGELWISELGDQSWRTNNPTARFDPDSRKAYTCLKKTPCDGLFGDVANFKFTIDGRTLTEEELTAIEASGGLTFNYAVEYKDKVYNSQHGDLLAGRYTDGVMIPAPLSFNYTIFDSSISLSVNNENGTHHLKLIPPPSKTGVILSADEPNDNDTIKIDPVSGEVSFCVIGYMPR